MIYIYDILLNFNDGILYEFYEWNTTDHIENMKKIKLVKVKKEDIDCLLNYRIVIDSEFLLKIFKTCEVYQNKGVEVLDYCCLFSDGTRVLAIEFNSKGLSEVKSKLLLDEEEEIAVLASNLEVMDISYSLLEEENKNRFFTRKEMKVKKYLLNEMRDSYKNRNYNKLKFLYAEYFDGEEIDEEKMYEELVHSMDQFLDEKHLEIYELLRLSHKKKQV